MQVKERENTLRDHVMHVLLDFRFEYLENRIKQVLLQLKSPLSMEEQVNIMEEYAKLKPLRDAIAKKLGRP
jgi:DNA primase